MRSHSVLTESVRLDDSFDSQESQDSTFLVKIATKEDYFEVKQTERNVEDLPWCTREGQQLTLRHGYIFWSYIDFFKKDWPTEKEYFRKA